MLVVVVVEEAVVMEMVMVAADLWLGRKLRAKQAISRRKWQGVLGRGGSWPSSSCSWRERVEVEKQRCRYS